jgi:adenosylcobyric acid synthase
MIEKRLGLPCVGVVPFIHDLDLDEEDGVALEDRASAAHRWKNLESGSARALRAGVIALPHMANFTDFDPLARESASRWPIYSSLKNCRRRSAHSSRHEANPR